MNPKPQVGSLLRRQRLQQHMTLADVADKLIKSESYISLVENNKRELKDLDLLLKWARVIGLSTHQLRQLTAFGHFKGASLQNTLRALSRFASRLPEHLQARISDEIRKVLDHFQAMMGREVEWAVIPVAGWWARTISPGTLVKLIEGTLDEIRRCGIENVVLVVAESQRVPVSTRLADQTTKTGIHIAYAVQVMPGLGNAIRCALTFIRNGPFILAFPDDRLRGDACLPAMINTFKTERVALVGLRPILQEEDVSSLGIAYVSETPQQGNELCDIKALIEKPPSGQCDLEGQMLAIFGRYLLTHEIASALAEAPLNEHTGCLELTDAIQILASRNAVRGFLYVGDVVSVTPRRAEVEEMLLANLARQQDGAPPLTSRQPVKPPRRLPRKNP